MNNPWKQYSKLNPQRENGNRQIASDVFHALMSAELSGSEFRIVMAVIDKTWGFVKETDCISTSQLMDMTGLAERTIKESIRILKDKRVLFYAPSNIRVRTGSPLNEYLFNKHYDTWRTIRVHKRACMHKTVNKGAENCIERVQDCSPTKETVQKKTTKEIPPTPKKIELPSWVPNEPWDGFVEMRKEIKKPLTGRAIQLAINKLQDLKSKGHDPGEVLDQSTLGKWQGLFPIRDGGNGKRHAGIKAWLERDDEKTGQGEVCQGDGGSVRDI